MLRGKIIEVVINHLLKFGVKECRMDAIASHLRVSKKTVYDLFGSKQNLLHECIVELINYYKKQIEEAEGKWDSPLHSIIAINDISLRQALGCSPSFYNDIEGDASMSGLFEREYIVFLKESYYRQFARAKEMGLLPPDTNIDHTLDFFEQQMRIMSKENYMNAMRKMENYSFVILTHLSGICTDKGREALLAISTK